MAASRMVPGGMLRRFSFPATAVILTTALVLGPYCMQSNASTTGDGTLDLASALAGGQPDLLQPPDPPRYLELGYGESGAVSEPNPASSREWRRNLALYLWFTGIEGKVGPRGLESEIDVSFSDIVDELDFGIMLYYEAMRRRAGYFVDLMYMDLRPDVPGKLKFEQTMLEVGGIYRWGTPEEAWDLLYGARYFDLSSDVQITGFPRVKGSQDWLEPFVGGRYITQVSDKWSLTLRGDIGGFGAGSDLTWGIRAMFLYPTGKNSWAIGWRYMDIDYDRSEFRFDVELNGPILAYVWGL